MRTLSLHDAVSPPTELVSLTVEQYHRMLATGVLDDGEPIELLDGVLVPKDRGDGVTMNPQHRLAVSRLMSLGPRVETGRPSSASTLKPVSRNTSSSTSSTGGSRSTKSRSRTPDITASRVSPAAKKA